jgi:hypothetical protein
MVPYPVRSAEDPMTPSTRDGHGKHHAEAIRARHGIVPGECDDVLTVLRLHDVAEEVRGCCGVSPLKAYRWAWGWTVDEAIRQFHRMCDAQSLGVHALSVRSWRGWEAGASTSERYQDLLCRLFRTSGVALGFTPDYTPDGMRTSRPDHGEDVPVRRRQFLEGVAGFALASHAGLDRVRAADVIRPALNDYAFDTADALSELDMGDVAALEHAVVEGQTLYQNARYERLGAMAPQLIRRAEAAARALDGDVQRRAHAALATVYHLVTALQSRTGETDLGWVTADRAIRAAEVADDSDLVVVGLYRLGHVMLRAGRPDEAQQLALDAVARHGAAVDARPGQVSLHGALLLVAALAAARQSDRREAHGLLRRAEACAGRLGEDRNDHWTAFGPTNVRIHAASCAVELGDPVGAVRAGEMVQTDGLPVGLRGRRSHVHVDLAWAYCQQRNDSAAVLSLLEAERIASEALRHDTNARAVIRTCVERDKHNRLPGLRSLAERTQVPA